MNVGSILKNLLPAFVIVAFVAGVSTGVRSSGQTGSVLQILGFTVIGIAWVAYFDHRKGNDMRGCTTILAFVFVPIFAFVLTGLDWLARRPELESAIGWAGSFRVPALMFSVTFTFFLITIGAQVVKRTRRKRFIHFFNVTLSALGLGIFAGLIGLLWIGLAFFLRKIGL